MSCEAGIDTSDKFDAMMAVVHSKLSTMDNELANLKTQRNATKAEDQHKVSLTASLSLLLSHSLCVWASALQPHTHTITQSHNHTHSSSLVLVVMMKSKELKIKISHTHSLILTLCVSLTVSYLLCIAHCVCLLFTLSQLCVSLTHCVCL